MSAMSEVREAAEYLDKYCANPDWREKVDLNRLNMGASTWCILGHIYGSYGNGTAALRKASSYQAFEEVEDAFNAYDDEWKAYLRENPVRPVELISSSVWRAISTPTVKVTACTEFRTENGAYVTYQKSDGEFITMPAARFREAYEPHKYEEGRLYRATMSNDAKQYIIMYSETASFNRPGFYNLTSNTHGSVIFWERDAEIVPLRACGDIRNKDLDVKL